MRRVLFTVVVAGLMLITACTNGDVDIEGALIEDTEDLQTLIETNEFLVQQLANIRGENDELKEALNNLQEETDMLKDNILSYRQEVHEIESLWREETALRNELDELAKEIFQAMSLKNHRGLEKLVDEETITVNGEAETLEVSHGDGSNMTYTFHFISLESVNYARQVEFNYNPNDKTFTSRYAFYTDADKDYSHEGEVILVFTYDRQWKLSSIRNNNPRSFN
ncbi:MAG: hypothetical protein LRY73_00355 [Bacillus sp. (in: Bacteria)]|nr:hypothetical protein [Bacillus sp. (in: firmicutes)]